MKNYSIYTTEGSLQFDYEKVFENLWAPLTDLQKEKVGFVEVYEGVHKVTTIKDYSVFKVRQSVRKEVKADALEREFNARIKKYENQAIQVEMDKLLEEVNQDLTRMSDITTKDYLVVYDHSNERFVIDGERGKAETCLRLVHSTFKENEEGKTPTFEVLKPEAFLVQPLLTKYLMDQETLPEPIILGDMVKIGKKALAGNNAPAPHIHVKNEDVASKETLSHLNEHKRVHTLQLDWDGIIYFNIDSTFMINSVSYEGSLDYKEDLDKEPEENWLAEYQQKLPEISKLITTMISELKQEE